MKLLDFFKKDPDAPRSRPWTSDNGKILAFVPDNGGVGYYHEPFDPDLDDGDSPENYSDDPYFRGYGTLYMYLDGYCLKIHGNLGNKCWAEVNFLGYGCNSSYDSFEYDALHNNSVPDFEGEFYLGTLEPFGKGTYKYNCFGDKITCDNFTMAYGELLPDGKGKIEYSDGDVFEGEIDAYITNSGETIFKLDGTMYYSTGKIVVGVWKGGEMISGETVENKQIEQSCNTSNDFQNAHTKTNGIINYDNGYYKGEILDNYRNGHGVYYFSNGDIEECDWNMGISVGKFRFEFANGSVRTGEYVNGKEHGYCHFVNDRLDVTELWIEGKRVSAKGKKIYSDGVYDGQFDGELNKSGGGVIFLNNGIKYEGSFNQDQKHGQFKKILQNGDYYKSKWANDKCIYRSELIFNSKHRVGLYDGTIYDGDFKDGNKEGFGRMEYVNGDIEQGQLINNHFTGKTKYTFENGDYKYNFYKGGYKTDGQIIFNSYKTNIDLPEGQYTGYMVDGLKSGKGSLFLPNGTKIECEFKNNISDGNGSIIYPNNDAYYGQVYNNKRLGQGTYIRNDGSQYSGSWQNDVLIGKASVVDNENNTTSTKFKKDSFIQQFFYGNEGTIKGKYKIETTDMSYRGKVLNTKPNGKGELKLTNGYLFKGSFVNGVRQGDGVLKKTSSGEEFDGCWLNGKMHGRFEHKLGNGDVAYELWDNGKFVEETFYEKNSQHLFIENDGYYLGEFKNNNKHGAGEFVFPNGVRYEGKWRNNEMNGSGTLTIPNVEGGKNKILVKTKNNSVIATLGDDKNMFDVKNLNRAIVSYSPKDVLSRINPDSTTRVEGKGYQDEMDYLRKTAEVVDEQMNNEEILNIY